MGSSIGAEQDRGKTETQETGVMITQQFQLVALHKPDKAREHHGKRYSGLIPAKEKKFSSSRG